MPVTVLVSLGGGGGGDVLDEFVDSVTFLEGATTYDLASGDGLSETMPDFSTDINTDAVVFGKDTPALRGLAKLQTMRGFWDASTYSGSGNWLNSGVGGAGLDFVLGAATAAPSFAAGVFTFDGVNDYMSIADNDLLDFLSQYGFSFGIIMTPRVAIVSGAAIMSKYAGSAAGYALQMASATTFQTTIADLTTTNAAGTQTCAVNTKQLFAGGRNSAILSRAETNKVLAATHTQTTNPLSSTGGGSTANALALTLGARPGLTNFCQMDVVGAYLDDRPQVTPDLINIAAYFGV